MNAITTAKSRAAVQLATHSDREAIYRLRHEVYARELGQHAAIAAARLTDSLDAHNVYLVVREGDELAACVSITPPGPWGYSIDKYFDRADLPLTFDGGLYEIRLLTVRRTSRRRSLALLMMYAALRWVESRGGTNVVALGRREVLPMYFKAGLEPLGRQARAGNVSYELLAATTKSLREYAQRLGPALRRIQRQTEWKLEVPFDAAANCYHGGAFFAAVGDDFSTLDRRGAIVNADVLDAWFDPSPRVLDALRDHLPWLLRTSPPTGCEGMIRAIAKARGVDERSILAGAGSSDLIFLALRQWLSPGSRVLILDPMYGEYAHVLEKVIGCRVDRIKLHAEQGFVLSPERLRVAVARGYDWVILVNPNSPTGRHFDRTELLAILKEFRRTTRFWIDETYIEYAESAEGSNGPQSVERYAAASRHVVVCKSMSKVYALSGVRAAYLCGAAELIDPLRTITPPWAVSLPGQVAAVAALGDTAYYRARWGETHMLREELAADLRSRCGLQSLPGVANFVLCRLPDEGPSAAAVVAACRSRGVFVRDVGTMGAQLGDRSLRIAVKNRSDNRRIVDAVAAALNSK